MEHFSPQRKPTLGRQQSFFGNAAAMITDAPRKAAGMGFGLVKIFAVAATRQDEMEIRAAERMGEARDVACADLRARMRKNKVFVRQELADAGRVVDRVKACEETLESALGETRESADELKDFKEKMLGDFELQERRPQWSTACRMFLDATESRSTQGNSKSDYARKSVHAKVESGEKGDKPDTTKLAKLIADHLEIGEPRESPHAIAVVLYHPGAPITERMKVAYTTGEVGLKTGQSIANRSKRNDALVTAIWDVVNKGEPSLNNPHGIAGPGIVSIMPLFSQERTRIGAVVSGGPNSAPVPDEFLQQLCSMAGQIFERTGKLEAVYRMIQNVELFITKQCAAEYKLVYPVFTKDAVVPKVDDEWSWQPLMYTKVDNDRVFELQLSWAHGEPIGVLQIELGTFTRMDEHLLAMLHTLAPVLEKGVRDAENLALGMEPPLATINQVMIEYELNLSNVATNLAAEMKYQVRSSMVFYSAMVETVAYINKIEDSDLLCVLQAILALAGYGTTKGWKEVKSLLSKSGRKVSEILGEIDLVSVERQGDGKKWSIKNMSKSDKVKYNRWNVADNYLKKANLDLLGRRSPVPVKILLRWLTCSRTVHRIAMAMAAGEWVQDPKAQRLFDQIDTDNSGVLKTEEVVAFLVSKAGSENALKLVRVLDTNGDGMITTDEWHKGWQLGEFEVMDMEGTDPDRAESAKQFMLSSKHLIKEAAKSKKDKKKDKKDGKKVAPESASAHAPAPAPALEVETVSGSRMPSGKKMMSEAQPAPAPAAID